MRAEVHRTSRLAASASSPAPGPTVAHYRRQALRRERWAHAGAAGLVLVVATLVFWLLPGPASATRPAATASTAHRGASAATRPPAPRPPAAAAMRARSATAHPAAAAPGPAPGSR